MLVLKRLLRSFQALLAVLLALPQRLLAAIARLARPGWRDSQSGFILPTVTLVILVVTLVVAAILARSFDRARNASNYRVNQATLSAASPALDRAKAKISAVFNDPLLLGGATPPERELSKVFEQSRYDLPDETRLLVGFDFRAPAGIQTAVNVPLDEQEVMTTAWRFPVDTNNNGRFDSFTLYGVFFRSSPASGLDRRERNPLEARTPPQGEADSGPPACQDLNTSASLANSQGWYEVGNLSKKPFFVYTATVPITSLNEANLLGSSDDPNQALNPNQFETYQGNRGFTGLEYQQDRAAIPLGNNAIVYEDDLDLFSGTDLLINGRIIVNSNLFAARNANSNNTLRLYQVSSDESCFYEAENAKIIVGGNVVLGSLSPNTSAVNNSSQIPVDLFEGRGVDPTSGPEGRITSTQESSGSTPQNIAYNTLAYEQRIERLVDEAILANSFTFGGNPVVISGDDPEAVRNRVQERVNNPTNPVDPGTARKEELDRWFRDRTRRVPFAEVGLEDNALASFSGLQGQGTDLLRPQNNWIYPFSLTNNALPENGVNLTLAQLPATDPDSLEEEELRLGDRASVGNGLPASWFDPDAGDFATDDTEQALVPPTLWTDGTPERYRKTRVRVLSDLGDTGRDGFWEEQTATIPEDPLDPTGGLRLVTGAGVYLPANDVLTNADRVVWPDTLPQPPDRQSNRDLNDANHPNYGRIVYDHDNDPTTEPIAIDDPDPANNPRRPYLKMRATAVYHYAYDNDNNLDTMAPPLACVSSFYDPTTSITARNRQGLPANLTSAPSSLNTPIDSGDIANSGNLSNLGNPNPGNTGNSNNGITYQPPSFNVSDPRLDYEAKLVYPNGRMVNPMLRQALEKLVRTGGDINELTIAERGAIDSTLCALQILDGTLGITTNPTAGFPLPHGTIQEVAFLDAQQPKQVDDRAGTQGAYLAQPETLLTNEPPVPYAQKDNPDNDPYVEQALPLEIRATVINLDVLRRQNITVPATTGPQTEWMFPDSGIIYATRDDALSDKSSEPARSDFPPDSNTPYSEADSLVNLALQELDEEKKSGTDFWLDPTRRPSAIMLIDGLRLSRGDNNSYFSPSGVPDGEEEKGLTLISNLPVYLKASNDSSANVNGFNIHTQQEFNVPLQPDYSNFYSRTIGQVNGNFACRAGDPQLAAPPPCTVGDTWRKATVLADALTILSDTFRPGFRNEGDYDLRNNQTDNLFRNIQDISRPNGGMQSNKVTSVGPPPPFNRFQVLRDASEAAKAYAQPARPLSLFNLSSANPLDLDTVDERRRYNGFWNNDFAVNGLSSDNDDNVFADNTTQVDQDYSSAGFTPGNEPLNSSYFNNFVTPVQRRQAGLPEFLMESCNKLPVSECRPEDWQVSNPAPPPATPDKASDLVFTNLPNRSPGSAGTTDQAPSAALQNLPRRVAFLRWTQAMQNVIDGDPAEPADDGALLLDGNPYSPPGTPGSTPFPTIDELLFTTPPTNPGQRVPIMLGIDTAGNVQCYTYGGELELQDDTGAAIFRCEKIVTPPTIPTINTNTTNALWFRYARTIDGNDGDFPIRSSLETTEMRQAERYDYDPAQFRGLLLEDPAPPYFISTGDLPPGRGLGVPFFNGNPGIAQDRKQQPLVVPVLQLHKTNNKTGGGELPYGNNGNQLNRTGNGDVERETYWLPRVNNSGEYNLIMAVGDRPARANEFNGAYANLPRFLEAWVTTADNATTAAISGSFIQIKRSAYATGPYWQMIDPNGGPVPGNNDRNKSWLGYSQRYTLNGGQNNAYIAPIRQWGFDVGLLSQVPDLFANRFTLPATDEPNEYFREVSRSDVWMETLLCARDGLAGNRWAVNESERPTCQW